ncbi:uncharacterized protein N7518_006670 [Penicillium psychrosexuale]|uniref:uncharacterized protein n=1 Tax=Penicillium psychrosexuale TaxID=1002107 RepID=UPI0025456DBF|nr:uncharacterized protein N7518_006670 [Penicillium psychrosexuale]KAJ5789659.1 hypothetical protein N7518_006670 [Penicillium psychrosexuale]
MDVLPVSVPQRVDLCSSGSSGGKARKHNLRQQQVFLTSSLMEMETPKTKTSEPVWFSSPQRMRRS